MVVARSTENMAIYIGYLPGKIEKMMSRPLIKTSRCFALDGDFLDEAAPVC